MTNHLNGLPLHKVDVGLEEVTRVLHKCEEVRIEFRNKNTYLDNGLTLCFLEFDEDFELPIIKRHILAAMEEIKLHKNENQN